MVAVLPAQFADVDICGSSTHAVPWVVSWYAVENAASAASESRLGSDSLACDDVFLTVRSGWDDLAKPVVSEQVARLRACFVHSFALKYMDWRMKDDARSEWISRRRQDLLCLP